MQYVDKRYFKVIFSWLVGIAVVYYFFDYTQVVEELIEKSIINLDNGLLILAAARYIFFETLFALPFLAGAFFLPDKGIIPGLVGAVFVLAYFTPSPEILLLVVIAILGYILLRPFKGEPFGTFVVFLVLLQLILGIEWLCFLEGSEAFFIGISDIPKDIKIAAEYAQGLPALSFVSIFLFIAFMLLSVLSARLFSYYISSLREVEKRKKEEMALQEIRVRAEEVRMLQEMHALVHDLKTPLMTIQGLNSLVEMSTPNEKTQEYCSKISTAVDSVNEMVSEILYDEVRKEIKVSDFINYVRAHVVVKSQGQKIRFKIAGNLPHISINHIRMARAFVNLIQNAFAATSTVENGLIEVSALEKDGSVVFNIADNGTGIAREDLEDIWTIGFSTKNSSGLGLSFVKRVVENQSGQINISSEEGKGTNVEIILPEVNVDDENSCNR